MVIDGMAESIELAKATLPGALDLAASHQVQVDGSGTASSAAALPTASNGAADEHLAESATPPPSRDDVFAVVKTFGVERRTRSAFREICSSTVGSLVLTPGDGKIDDWFPS